MPYIIPYRHKSYRTNASSLLILISMLCCAITARAMEYGLRFNSYNVPENQRTSLTLGDTPYRYADRLDVDFDMSFYARDMYGLICTIATDNGTTVNLLSSARGRSFYPTLVVSDSIYTIPSDFSLDHKQPYHIKISLDKTGNKIELSIDGSRYSFAAQLGGTNGASVTLGGKSQSYNSAPPVDIKDVRVYTDGRNTAWWELREHEGDTIRDNISGRRTAANNPTWLHDAHSRWTLLYSLSTEENIQSAYNPATDDFYIAGPGSIIVWNATTSDTTWIDIDNDGRVMKMSNYLTYNPVDNKLLSYDMSDGATSSFDFATGQWSYRMNDRNSSAAYSNHSFLTNGKNAYTFGGYGFHSYHNDFFEIDFATDSIRRMNLNPAPSPRTSSAAGIADGKLYIFGGIGNESGRQEMPLETYYDLWEYDMSTFNGKRLWSIDKPYREDFICSSQMYYVAPDSAFYFASTLTGGTLMRMSPYTGKIERMSEPIVTQMQYRDCVFDFYRSDSNNNFYLVIDKRYDNLSHELSIYRITYPFVPYTGSIGAVDSTDADNTPTNMLWATVAIAAITIITFTAIVITRRIRRRHSLHDNSADSISDDNHAKQPIPQKSEKETGKINLLGNFTVTDRDGNDITTQFSTRTRDLLAILILWSLKNNKGIAQHRLDEDIWHDKGLKSAKTNRNVYIHRLRSLLESIGDMQIVYDKGYYRLMPGNVAIDYATTTEAMEAEHNSDQGIHIVELLESGTLLPECNASWADPFKAEFSSRAQALLCQLLLQEESSPSPDADLIYRIAEALLLHDPLSEEALSAKCRILYNRKQNSRAKTVYDSFCREYLASFGEPYPVTFPNIISRK